MHSYYFHYSRTTYYSLVASLPLLVIYEILLALESNSYWQIRNAADVWLRMILQAFELTSQQASLIMICMVFVGIAFSHSEKTPIRRHYLGWMLVESLIYSLLLGIIIQAILTPILFASGIASQSFLQRIALSIGAGLFEELVFRVLAMNALFFMFRWVFKSTLLAGGLAVLGASFLFSLSHYIGPMADSLEVYSFLFRWVAGLLFTMLYAFRGFAITAYTHALYDIWVLV